jgi:hypothetical protein
MNRISGKPVYPYVISKGRDRQGAVGRKTTEIEKLVLQKNPLRCDGIGKNQLITSSIELGQG